MRLRRLALLLSAVAAEAAKDFLLTVESGFRTPDCVSRIVAVVNGSFPGPPLRVKAGEQVRVTVRNNLEGVSVNIHWHGTYQTGSVWADGAARINSCPIAPGSEFVYAFKANPEPGTYFYHGHVGEDKDMGVYGMFIVEPGSGGEWPYAFDAEHSLLLQDWYHASGVTLTAGLEEEQFRWVGDPQSVLVNGVGEFNCTDNPVYDCADPSCALTTQGLCSAVTRPYYLPAAHHKQCEAAHCPAAPALEVEKGQRVLIRLANVASLSLFNVAVEGHNVTLVEMDGLPVQPLAVPSIDLHAGQHAGFVFTADQAVDRYWISVAIRGRSGVRHGQAVIVYKGAAGFGGAGATARRAALRASQPAWDDSDFTRTWQDAVRSLPTSPQPPQGAAARRFVFLGTQERFDLDNGKAANGPSAAGDNGLWIGTGAERPENNCGPGYLRWGMRRRTYGYESTPPLHMLYYDVGGVDAAITEDRGYYRVEEGKVYDVILQNYPACNQVCETHPWHLHGHHFWLLGTFPGEWDGNWSRVEEAAGKNPSLRNTAMVVGQGAGHKPFPGPSGTPQQGCGYIAVRFVANNPGVWGFHCHALWHLVMGMIAVFYYPASTLPAPDLTAHSLCGRATPAVAVAKHAACPTCRTDDCGDDSSVPEWVPVVLVAVIVLLAAVAAGLFRALRKEKYPERRARCVRQASCL